MASRGEEVPLVNYKDKMKQTFGRTTSCVSNPQLSALEALKENNLQLLCDLLNELPDEFDVNSAYEEERQKTLLHIAAETGNADAVKLLLSAGADVAMTNKKTGQTTLHASVAKKVNGEVFRILLNAGSDINARADSGRTVLHLLAKKCLSANYEDAEAALYCLNLVLAQRRNVEVDAPDDAGGQTPLYIVANGSSRNANYFPALKSLIQAGADWSLKCGDDVTIRDKIKEETPPHTFKVLEKAAGDAFYVSGQSIGSAVKQSLATMIEEAELKDDDGEKHDVREFEKALAAASLVDLEAQSPGEIGLVQKAAEAGLHRHVRVLLRKGLDPNRYMEGTAPAVVAAAKRGNHEVMRVLKDAGGTNFTVVDPKTRCTVLHCILRRFYGADGMSLQYEAAEMEARYLKCLDLILGDDEDAQGASAFNNQIRGIVNAKDDLDNTALHYATQMWPQSVTRRLLERGANVGMKNRFDEVPVEGILPSTMEDFLNEFCLRSVGDPTNRNFRVTMRYDFLAPPREGEDGLVSISSGSQSKRSRREGWASSSEKSSRKDAVTASGGKTQEDNGREKQKPRPDDIEAKHAMIDANQGASLSSSSSTPPLPETEVIWHMSQSDKHKHLLKHPVITSFLWLKWKRIGSAYNKSLIFYFAFVAVLTAFIFLSFGGAEQLLSDTCKDDKGINISWYILLVLLIILFAREFLQFGIAPRRYFFSIENCFECVMIALVAFLLCTVCDPAHLSAGRHAAAVAIVVAWSEWITMVGRHPRLSTFNIYVTMFYKVTTTFIFFLIWYSCFIFAFALGFYILLHKKEEEVKDDDYPFFNTISLSIVKTFTMFVGELEFGDLPIDTGAGYVFFLSFIFLIVVVMMNLLNGLAVSDTGVIREEAEMNYYATQVEVISYVESMLLGDPFNFLSNWPAFVWLRRVPSCSLGSTLYRVPPLRYIFHKITGAPKVLLFYDYLPDKKVTFYPNDQPAYCGCLGGGTDEEDHYRTKNIPRFPKEILDAVKASVLDNERAKDSLEERLARAEESNKELAKEVGKLADAVMNMTKQQKRF